MQHCCMDVITSPWRRHMSLVTQFKHVKPSNHLSKLESFSQLTSNFEHLKQAAIEIKPTIGNETISTKTVLNQICPFDRKITVARYHRIDTPDPVHRAIQAAIEAKPAWSATPVEDRCKILIRMADKLENSLDDLQTLRTLLAATVLGQGKTVKEADIDASCKLIDYLRFDPYFVMDTIGPRFRSLNGFVAAITPFNFTSIAMHLVSAAVLMGNVVLWKPSDFAMLSNYMVFELFEQCGLPPGVVNFVPAEPQMFVTEVAKSPHLSAINFVGSTDVFRDIVKKVMELHPHPENVRFSGECGGNNFHLIHPSCTDINGAVNATVYSAYGYGGQKCSACSRCYIPKSTWPEFKRKMLDTIQSKITVGDPTTSDCFISALISQKAKQRFGKQLQYAMTHPEIKLLTGKYQGDAYAGEIEAKGHYVWPALFETSDLGNRLMMEEPFTPILVCHTYADSDFDSLASNVANDSLYALSGSLFIDPLVDCGVALDAIRRLRYSCGNLNINQACTWSTVDRQPFGGSRLLL